MNLAKKNISIIIISHNSKKKVLNFIKKISKDFKILVIENSNDKYLQRIIERNYREINFKIIENNGYGAAINYASKLIETDYFFVFNPDLINIDDQIINIFYEASAKLNDNFLCLGPRFLNVTEKSHNQSDMNIKIAPIKAINGACMFINKKKFELLNGFDENFFLFFEENDFCKRGLDNNFKIYQVNDATIIHEAGTSVSVKKENEKEMQDLRTWHFIWSKFYYFKKHYSYFLAILYFIPIIIRILYRIIFHMLAKNKDKKNNYIIRLKGLFTSILLKKSHKRI
jgi:N-acetylglucosaminyl-diphospho-decaprenol L-rhamnosyltransferase